MPFAYTCPSPGRYPYQWYWDSCFSAIARRHVDPDRSRQELLTLIRAQDSSGFIPHTIFWSGRVSALRAGFYNIRKPSDRATSTIQPPLLAWAWELVADASGTERDGFVAAGLEPLKRHYDQLERDRDIGGAGLLSIIQPDESGLDHSPKFDQIWGNRGLGPLRQPVMVARNRRLGFNARRIAERHGDQVEEVLTNVLYILGLRALARLSKADGDRYRARADLASKALIDRCFDNDRGLFFDRVGFDGRALRVNTWSSLAPLALPDLPAEIAARLVEHLLDTREYRAPVPVPSVAMNEPSFRPGDSFGPLRRYWRGPSWVNSAWLLLPRLRNLGFRAEAHSLTEALLENIAREGIREYYNARTGAGLGARDFAWSTLALDLIGQSACD